MFKKLITLMLSLAVLFSISIPVSAASADIKKTEYEGRGYTEVEFYSDMEYKNVKVTVTDPSGRKMAVSKVRTDEDEVKFHVAGLKPSTKYIYKISGVRPVGTTEFKTVKGSFKTPATELYIKKVKYDSEDQELDVDFFTRVQYKKLKVTLKDENGKSVTCRITEKGSDDLELKVPAGLRKGAKYTVTVQGIRVYKTGKYTTIKKTFKVR